MHDRNDDDDIEGLGTIMVPSLGIGRCPKCGGFCTYKRDVPVHVRPTGDGGLMVPVFMVEEPDAETLAGLEAERFGWAGTGRDGWGRRTGRAVMN